MKGRQVGSSSPCSGRPGAREQSYSTDRSLRLLLGHLLRGMSRFRWAWGGGPGEAAGGTCHTGREGKAAVADGDAVMGMRGEGRRGPRGGRV